jgi:steroid delta-isomerase-like uncharacterized protein
MSAEDNAKLVRECYSLFEKNQLDRAASYVTPESTWEMVPTGETFRGPTGFLESMKILKTAYPDVKIKIVKEIASDHAVAVEFRATGTHKGTLKTPQGDIPATGKKVEFQIFEVWEVHNGKVTRLRSYFDASAMMQQLGQLGKAA